MSYLEKEINYVKPVSVMYEGEFFQDNNNSEMNKIAQGIRRFNDFVKEPLCEKNNKHKL